MQRKCNALRAIAFGNDCSGVCRYAWRAPPSIFVLKGTPSAYLVACAQLTILLLTDIFTLVPRLKYQLITALFVVCTPKSKGTLFIVFNFLTQNKRC